MFGWENDVLFVCFVVDYLLCSVTSADDVDVIAASCAALMYIVVLVVVSSSWFGFNFCHWPIYVRLHGIFPGSFWYKWWLSVS